jgi:hypothetical protein
LFMFLLLFELAFMSAIFNYYILQWIKSKQIYYPIILVVKLCIRF